MGFNFNVRYRNYACLLALFVMDARAIYYMYFMILLLEILVTFNG